MDKELAKQLKRLLDRWESGQPQARDPKPGCHRWLPTDADPSRLAPLPNWQGPELAPLVGLEDEIRQLRANTKAFVAGKHANHAVLTGPRGCGKSTVMHGVAAEFKGKAAIVKVSCEHLALLPLLAEALSKSKLRFLLLCDELSFGAHDRGLLAAKSALDELDGGQPPMLLYATSNRRRMVPESHADNQDGSDADELHPGEGAEEKVSFSDRFGLWLPFFTPEQEEYL
nr:DUF815 domain-containing protein [Betaproteobacteria bacterium AqS2]